MKRQTLQKAIILQTLSELCNHPTPAMVYEKVHEKYPTISQATVFRVLAGECEAGNAQRVYAPGSSTRYEYGTRRHYHVSCRLCGKIADVEMPMPDEIKGRIIDSEGFTVENCYIEFIGLCPECRKHRETDGEDIK